MSVSISDVLIVTTMSFCTQSRPSSTPTASGFSCDDYEIMLDVEFRLSRECSVDSDCEQVLFEGDLECESNALVGNAQFDSSYLYDLYDEATLMGCTIDLPINDSCSRNEMRCVSGTCTWN
jgi:hypothetical protein